MCGIAGYARTWSSSAPLEGFDVLRRMTSTLTHRGPDASGFQLLDRVALGHRRLSILDQHAGAQPMSLPARNLSVSYNGEIYNYRQLNDELAALGLPARTRSDTETLLLAYAAWGEQCLDHFEGMFAFTLYDAATRRLFAARDRMGEKPLYYLHTRNLFIFASEPRAILEHPAVIRQLDPQAAAAFLVYEHVPAPQSIYRHIHKLEAGQKLTFDLNTGKLDVTRWWHYPAAAPTAEDEQLDEAAWSQRIRTQLERSVQQRLVSDVPLGVFLSGGIDSAAIAAAMVQLCSGRQSVRTFSIGFDDADFDEADQARDLARHLGTDHHEQRLTMADAMQQLPELSQWLDEPLADASILPTCLLARFTRQHVTVALSGDGGDELFAGYQTFHALRAARVYNACVPRLLHQHAIQPAAKLLRPGQGYFSFDFKLKQFLRGLKSPEPQRLWRWLGAFAPEELLTLLTPDALRSIHLEQLFAPLHDLHAHAADLDAIARDTHTYARTYLPEQVLVKVDRAAMRCSLETRAPLLDSEMIQLASRIPSRHKVRSRVLKHVFRQSLRGLVPDHVLTRPKRGFAVPMGRWFREGLRDLLIETLSPRNLREGGWFEPATVARLLDEHLAGQRDHRKPLFTLFMFERWRQTWCKPRSAAAFSASAAGRNHS